MLNFSIAIKPEDKCIENNLYYIKHIRKDCPKSTYYFFQKKT